MRLVGRKKKKEKERGFLKDFRSKGRGQLKICQRNQQLGERGAESGQKQDVSDLNSPVADLLRKGCSEFLLL